MNVLPGIHILYVQNLVFHDSLWWFDISCLVSSEYVRSHLDFAFGLHHLEFGLGQLLFQLPDLHLKGLLLLVALLLLSLSGTILILAWFIHPIALCHRVLSRGGCFFWIYGESTVRAKPHYTLQRWAMREVGRILDDERVFWPNFDIQEFKSTDTTLMMTMSIWFPTSQSRTAVKGEMKEERIRVEHHRKSAIRTLSESSSSLWAACCLSRRFVSWEQIWAEGRASSVCTFSYPTYLF